MPGFSARDFAEFNGLLAAGVERGLAVEPALDLLAGQARSRTVGDALRRVVADLKDGKPLEKALETAAGLVPPEYPALVAAGAASRALAPLLRQVESYHALLARIRERFTRFLLYLGLGFFVALLVVGLVGVAGSRLYQEQNRGWHWRETEGVRLAAWLHDHHLLAFGLLGVGMGAGLGLALLLLRWASRRGIGYWIPVWGPLFRSRDVAVLCGVAALRLRSGATAVAALEAAAQTTSNRRARREIEAAARRVSDGVPLSEALFYRRWFPRTLVWALSVGERRGDVADVLDGFARIYRSELDRRFEVIFLLLTPLGILALGNLVLGVVLTVILPILSWGVW